MTRPPVNRDLFGAPPVAAPRDTTPVSLRMKVCDQTEAAWLLAPDGVKGAATWAPKSKVSRGEGLTENLFTMPRWVARERGWL